MDDSAVLGARQELGELRVVLLRTRGEISNLTVGYQRAQEGLGPIPAAPLQRNLMAKRAELTRLEERIAELQAQLPAEG